MADSITRADIMRGKCTWNFVDVVEALKKSFQFAYTIRRRNKNEAIPYDGPELTACSILATTFNTRENLGTEGLNYHRENGRNALDVILGCAFRLGMEQGFRVVADENRIVLLGLSAVKSILESKEFDEGKRGELLEILENLEENLKTPGGIEIERKE